MLSSLAFAALALAAQASCQTPPGSLPTTGNTLAVDFPVGRNGYVEPNELLNQGVVANQPGISTHRSLTGTYMILMMDLSILDELTGKPAKQLVPGLQTNRTTFCHWLQTGLHQERNGMLASTNASALAPYQPPAPPRSDPLHHTYALYLFRQPSNFTLPSIDSGRNLTVGSLDRISFSAIAIAREIGEPIAANYFRVQVSGSKASSTPTPTPTPATSAGMRRSSAVKASTIMLTVLGLACWLS